MASNVGMMGRMFPSAGISPTVNDTSLRSYSSGERLTNHFVTAKTVQGGMMFQSDYYFDQETGMMVEWREQTIQTNGNLLANSTQWMRINSSSAWVIPELAGSLVMAFIGSILGASSIVLVTLKRKGRLTKSSSG
jgi:hypothetical protein